MRAAVLAVLVLTFASACGGSSSTTTAPSTSTTATLTEFSMGTLAVQGSSFYSFTVQAAGVANITLGSITSSTLAPVNVVMGLGIGTPSGTTCSLTGALNTTPGLVAQLAAPVAAGVYCADLYDIGNLTGPVNFVVRIVHP